MEGKIIAFIGLPGSGKTSVAQDMMNRLENAVLMPEVAETAATKGFEVADRASIGTETWFLTQYYTRGVEAKKLKEDGKIVIMDGNYANSLAFGFANFVKSNNPSFFMHFPSYIVNKAVDTLVKPDAYIYFKIPIHVSIRRQDKRQKEELRTKDTHLEYVSKFYKTFFSILEPEIPLFEIDSSQPKERVIKNVENIFLKELRIGITKKLK